TCGLMSVPGIASPLRIAEEGDPVPVGAASLPLSQALGTLPSSILSAPKCSAVNFPLATSVGDQFWSSAIPDGAGGMIVAWQDPRNGATGSDIYAQHVLDCGSADPAWPAGGVALTTAAGDQIFPVIATDGAGGAFVAWNEGAFPFPGFADVFAQHVLSTGAIDPAWPVDGVS